MFADLVMRHYLFATADAVLFARAPREQRRRHYADAAPCTPFHHCFSERERSSSRLSSTIPT